MIVAADARLAEDHNRILFDHPIIFEFPPQNEITLTSNDIENIKRSYMLKQNAILKVQELHSSNKFSVNGKQYTLDEMERVEVFTPDAKYLLDGMEQKFPPVKVFTKSQHDVEILVRFDRKDRLDTIILTNTTTGATVGELVPTLEKEYLITVTNKDVDQRRWNERFRLADGVKIKVDEKGKWLGSDKTRKDSGLKPKLKRKADGPCVEYRVIEIAVDYESSFCSHHGGSENAYDAVISTVASTSIRYQQKGLCRVVHLSQLNGYCNPLEDPYLLAVKENKSGCNGYGLLSFFAEYHIAYRTNVKRDAAMLFSGTGLECDLKNPDLCVVGCANIESLCSDTEGYGVTYATFVNSTNFRSILVAHELGHISGADHKFSTRASRGEYIMEETIEPIAQGFSESSIQKMDCYMDESSCPNRTMTPAELGFERRHSLN